jgi:hypothetical protein
VPALPEGRVVTAFEHSTDALCGRVAEYLEGALHAQASLRGSLEHALNLPVPEMRAFEAKLEAVAEEAKSLRLKALRVAASLEGVAR